MTNETQQKKPDKPVRTYSGGTAKEWIVSTIVGLVSGTVALGAAIRNEFNAESKSLPGMADFIDGNGLKHDGLITKHKNDLEKTDLKFKGQPEKALLLEKEIRALKKVHVQDKIELFEKDFGIASKGLKGLTQGTYRRFMRLGGSNIGEVLFKGTSIAVIVGVGVYNLLTSIATRKKAREIEDLILDKLEVVANDATHIEATKDKPSPTTQVSHVTNHDRLRAANSPEIAARA